MTKDQDVWLAGVDGCMGGWIVAFVRRKGREVRQRIIPSFSEILAAPEQPFIVAVDMPIGLPKLSPPKGRLAESTVRPLLGARKSSVFRIPSRCAVYAGTRATPIDERERYFAACEIARKTSEDKKAFAKQGFYIFPKIVEIDEFLRDNPWIVPSVFEIHPEVAFWRLNGNQALLEPKKKKSRLYPPGLRMRRQLLTTNGFSGDTVDFVPPRSEAGMDDWLDALACAAIARRIYDGHATSFPPCPPRDEFGLPMAIWA